MKQLLLLFCLLLSQSNFAAIILGKVMDAEGLQAIEAVSVFINGSSIGTVTAADGSFEIKGNFVFPLDLVFQNLAYETKSVRIKQEGALSAPVKLLPKLHELNEVVVLAPLKNGWDVYGKDFLNSFLSYSDFSNQCEIVNKKAVQFKVDNAAGILYVYATAPIIIKNKALGYFVHFDLQDFKRDYGRQTTHFAGYTRFEPMKTKSKKQQLKWESNRKSAYYGSLNHFVRAAYNNTVEQDGFQLNVIVRAPASEYGERVPVWTDTLNLKDSTDRKVFWKKITASLDTSTFDNSNLLGMVFAIYQWVDTVSLNVKSIFQPPLKEMIKVNVHKFHLEKIGDAQFQIKHFQTNRLPPSVKPPFVKGGGITFETNDTVALNKLNDEAMERMAAAPFDYLYTTPYPIDSFLKIDTEGKKLFSENLIQVMYKNEVEEMNYVKVNQRCGTPNKPCSAQGPQTSTLVFPQKRAVYLMSNGNYNEQYDLFLEGYWSFEKLDKMLPLDYEP